MEDHVIHNFRATNYEIISCSDEFNQCFACSKCNRCLAGKEVVHQNDKTYCWKCFESLFGLRCVSCLKPITGLSQMSFVFYNNQAWHRECFYCSNCQILLKRTGV